MIFVNIRLEEGSIVYTTPRPSISDVNSSVAAVAATDPAVVKLTDTAECDDIPKWRIVQVRGFFKADINLTLLVITVFRLFFLRI